MKKNFYKACLMAAVFVLQVNCLFCQAVIKGPSCVIAGAVYEYNIDNIDSTFLMQVCVTGGIIADAANNISCTQRQTLLNRVLVVWDDSAYDTGSLLLISPSDSSRLVVYFTQPLQSGAIDSTSKIQFVGVGSLPAVIGCSGDIGGSCTPFYAHQWQQSTDGISWSDLAGAKDSNLSINSVLSQTTYFRRKVTEINSGTIAYSDVSAVFIKVKE